MIFPPNRSEHRSVGRARRWRWRLLLVVDAMGHLFSLRIRRAKGNQLKRDDFLFDFKTACPKIAHPDNGLRGWATLSLLFGVLGEDNGILFEDVDEDVVEESFHRRVGVAERRAGILRRREVVGELLDFLDDVACACVLVFELLDEGERLFVRGADAGASTGRRVALPWRSAPRARP